MEHSYNRQNLAKLMEQILQELKLQTESEGLKETPLRWAKMMEELIQPEEFNFTTFTAEGGHNDEMIIVKDIPFYSLCEHHIIPFFGIAHVAYIPNKQIVGLSKIPRTVDYFSKGLQTQERITESIADFLMEKLDPKGVGVILKARHLCMEMRGVKKYNNYTVTSALRGVFTHGSTRQEFLSLVQDKL